ncbi:BBL_G0013410.mRNA.1.CDS.1 [Saccharomyces cerevisiae]|nr:BBL_G0013410.mRNA.1.CDS.1 [Saccharomyces cerevisiae]CAI7086490.1 BBL_G0013410.mRNA.1.CDS.1 [Saccharomyces cerevisiae]
MRVGKRSHRRNIENSSGTNMSGDDFDNVLNYEMKEIDPKEKEIGPIEREHVVEYFEDTVENNIRNEECCSKYQASYLRRFVDSFKRAELQDPNSPDSSNSNGTTPISAKDSSSQLDNELNRKSSYTTVDGIKQPPQEQEQRQQNLKKSIKPHHIIMMSLGTGIGTGLLVGNSKVLNEAGPAALVIGYAIMGSCIYCIIQACGELAVIYSDLIGGFNTYPSFLVDPALGFSVAWVYCLQWLCVCPLELVTASMTIKYWTTSVNPDVFVVIFYVLIVVINVFGAKGYAEADFFFNCCKILMIVGFFILAIIVDCGGAGTDGYIGSKYWRDPGAFRGDTPIQRFKGVVATFVTAAFAFGMSEQLAMTASEQSNPRKAIPSAAKKMIYRILVVYLGSLTLLGFLVPYNSDQLLGAAGSATKASPYVIAIASHGVRVVPHFINAVILLSVLSVGNSAFYSSSRVLMSLAKQGNAPKWFDYIDREGRPARAMIVSALFGVIAFCAASKKEEDVFTWLLAISGLSELFTWITICLSHIRFRRAMKVQGRSLGEVGYKSQVGVWGSAYAVLMMVLALIAQFWVAISPIGGGGKLSAQSFFENYLAMPILIALYIFYKVWKKDWSLFIPAGKVDLVSHRNIFDEELLKQEDEEYKERLRNGPYWKRVLDFWC